MITLAIGHTGTGVLAMIRSFTPLFFQRLASVWRTLHIFWRNLLVQFIASFSKMKLNQHSSMKDCERFQK